MRLDERRASRAACLSCGLCAQLAWASRYWCNMRTGELGRRKILGRWRNGFLTGPKCSEAPVPSPSRPRGSAHGAPGRARSILGTVSLHHNTVWPWPFLRTTSFHFAAHDVSSSSRMLTRSTEQMDLRSQVRRRPEPTAIYSHLLRAALLSGPPTDKPDGLQTKWSENQVAGSHLALVPASYSIDA